MDDTTKGQAPATDDQELAKVLAGMNQQVKTIDPPAHDDAPASDTTAPNSDGLKFEETPAATPAPSTDAAAVVTPEEPATEPAAEAADKPEEPKIELEVPTHPAPSDPNLPAPSLDTPAVSSDLDGLKKDALAELRPLVDHLDLPANEKFDTLLLIIRSTDDKSLLASAHEAAKSIEDETKRAQALLDIIKEIDYFSAQPAAA